LRHAAVIVAVAGCGVKKASWEFTLNGGNGGGAEEHLYSQKAVEKRLSKDLKRRFQMFKRVGVLALMLAGGLGVLAPSVAQARDWDNHRQCERREYRRCEDRHERWERRHYRPYYYNRY
jgi:hypothetical protein